MSLLTWLPKEMRFLGPSRTWCSPGWWNNLPWYSSEIKRCGSRPESPPQHRPDGSQEPSVSPALRGASSQLIPSRKVTSALLKCWLWKGAVARAQINQRMHVTAHMRCYQAASSLTQQCCAECTIPGGLSQPCLTSVRSRKTAWLIENVLDEQ